MVAARSGRRCSCGVYNRSRISCFRFARVSAELVEGLTEAEFNARPAGVASVAFHVQHIAGVIDRLFSYARGEALSDAQFVAASTRA